MRPPCENFLQEHIYELSTGTGAYMIYEDINYFMSRILGKYPFNHLKYKLDV